MIYVVYVKSNEFEYVFAYLNKEQAEACAKPWNKYAKIIEVAA